MNRRHFLAGVIGGPIAGGLLLRTAPEASAVLIPDTPVIVTPPSRVTGTLAPDLDPYLYNRHGEPIALIESFTMSAESIDMTAYGDAFRHFAPGIQRVDIRAVGVPDLVIEINTDLVPRLDRPRYQLRKRR
jgi:hypothetical protein